MIKFFSLACTLQMNWGTPAFLLNLEGSYAEQTQKIRKPDQKPLLRGCEGVDMRLKSQDPSPQDTPKTPIKYTYLISASLFNLDGSYERNNRKK